MRPPSCLLAATLALAAAAGLARGQALTPAFTYQGELKTSGALPTGSFDFQFRLFDALTGGAQIGSTQTVGGLVVNQGRLTTPLNFGAGAFDGARRWLEIAVRPSGATSFTTLAPRQELMAAPYAWAADRVALPMVATGDTDPAGLITTGLFQINQQGDNHAILGSTSGAGAAVFGLATAATGQAGRFLNSNAASAAEAIFAENSGTGPGVFATSDRGRAGWFRISNTSNAQAAVFASTAGTGRAVEAQSLGTGNTVHATKTGPSGHVGYFINSNAANGSDALYAQTAGAGAALSGRADSGAAVDAYSLDGPALNIQRGHLRVEGVGSNTNTPVFIHTVSAANTTCEPDCFKTTIDHPLVNGDPSAILFVTPSSNGVPLSSPVTVVYDSQSGRWSLFCIDWENWPVKIGTSYNVLVFKR